MSIPFSIPVLLLGAIIAQGIFAALILFFHQRNPLPNKFLSLLLLSFSLWLIDSFYKVAHIYEQNPDFYFQPIFYSFAFGPLIYFYVKTLTNNTYRLKKKDFLHFVPTGIQALLYWFLTFQAYDFKRWFWMEVHHPITYDLEYDLTLLSLFVYLLLSIRLLKKYQVWLQNNFSEFSKINLNWLKIILSIMGVLCLLWGIDVFLRDVLSIYQMHNFSEIIMGVAVLLLAFGSIRQNSIVDVEFKESKDKAIEVAARKEKIDVLLLEKIKVRMETNQDFLNPTLTLKDFAKNLHEPSRNISIHINQGLQMSFVDFVNQYRVAAVKQQIAVGALANFTLLAIALESGFNSKSTFNRVFKKSTGMSPSEYLKMNN